MRAAPWIAAVFLLGSAATAFVGGQAAAPRIEARWEREVEPLLPPGISVQVEGRTATISGAIADDATRLALLADMRREHPKLRTINEMTIDPLAPSKPASSSPPSETVSTPPRTVATPPRFDPRDAARCEDRLFETLRRNPIVFSAVSAALHPGSAAALDSIATVLRAYPNLRVEITGHADRRGEDDLNRPLSQTRAEAIRQLLIQRGIARGRLIAVGYGASQPVADNATEKGRRLNRRIEFLVRGEQP